MTDISLANPYFKELADEHRTWLKSFDARHLANWEKLLNGDAEPAFCEVAVRRLLESFGVTVSPNEDLKTNGGGPDFRCEKNGAHFYVEVTCVLRDKFTERTGVSEIIPEEPVASSFDGFAMTEAIMRECSGKAKQCGGMDAPTIVAVGTFHVLAPTFFSYKPLVSSILTGKPQLVWNIDVRTGMEAGESQHLTHLENAAFLKPDNGQQIGFARSSISGLLLCGLSSSRCLGILHPNPARPFDAKNMPNVEFANVQLDQASQRMQITWLNGGDE